jgi:predicted molibdopterin-dependent oxidoreductase YjgC
MDAVRLTIDGIEVEAREGGTILEAAQNAALYIPALCAHPDLSPAPGIISREVVFQGGEAIRGTGSRKFEGCQLCIVEIEGREGTYLACNTPATEGMVVHTNTPQLQEQRRENLAKVLIKHPHTCLICAQKEGCSLTQCSSSVPEKERCCPKFSYCELRKIAEYIGIKEDIPRYIPQNLPIVDDEPLVILNYNLCIGCLRCVRACQDLQKIGALGFVYRDKEVIVGTIAPTLKKSNCKSCGACIEVCPTGTLLDKSEKAKAVRARKLKISPPILPPTELLKFDTQTIGSIPEVEGVYQLLDEQKSIIYIKGTMNLRQELQEQLETNKQAHYFKWEEEPMYTRRESELIQQFLQAHGRLPAQNDELAELF